jgi:tyrosine decarboxylase/aspartate 1-decarboxylase
MFLDANLGDAGIFEGAAKLEKDVVSALADLLHGKEAVGFVVSGGTEANLMALYAAKNATLVPAPEVILAQSSHFSFSKICRMLNIKPVYAKLQDNYTIDPQDVKRLITPNTVAIVGTVGTSELGVVDSIEALAEIALSQEVWLHVDAAFGGLVLPFLKTTPPPFDFSLNGVQSITVDPHKMGMAAIPAGGILFRSPTLLETLRTQTPYLTEAVQYTFGGTRSGASAASAWAVFQLLGREGFQKVAAKCLDNTRFLGGRLKKSGFTLVVEPPLNVVAFRGADTRGLARKLCRLGWFVSYVPRYDCIRVVVMPHVKRRHVVAFLKALMIQ